MSNPNNRAIAPMKQRKSKPNGKEVARSDAQDSLPAVEKVLPYEEREQRERAARILANDELLMWMSEQRNETVLQTRIYYQARASGLRDEDLRFDHKLDLSEERDFSKGKSPAAKGTARVVSGSGSSKNTGSPANKRDKDGNRPRRSNGAAR